MWPSVTAATGSDNTMQDTFHHASGPGQPGTNFPQQAAGRPVLKEG